MTEEEKDKLNEAEFSEYLRHVAPSKAEAAWAWGTAIGLQKVDGLTTSEQLRDTARRNIEGEISIDEAEKIMRSYYITKEKHDNEVDVDEKEGDLASLNIGRLLQEPTFTFSRAGLQAIHKRIFNGVFKWAGQLRDYEISKKEWVLRGDSVTYGFSFELEQAIDYDLQQEKEFSYSGLSIADTIEHLAKFIAGLWQIHPFGEGNTRTSAVFLIKYLRQIGFSAENDMFEKYSWYFRNALVRANYRNVKKGIEPDSSFLVAFIRNLLLGENNPLHNRYMLIGANLVGKTDQVHRLSTDQVEAHMLANISDEEKNIIRAIGNDELSNKEIMARLGLKHAPTYRDNYLNPALADRVVARLYPDSPRHPRQRYLLTVRGQTILQLLTH